MRSVRCVMGRGLLNEVAVLKRSVPAGASETGDDRLQIVLGQRQFLTGLRMFFKVAARQRARFLPARVSARRSPGVFASPAPDAASMPHWRNTPSCGR